MTGPMPKFMGTDEWEKYKAHDNRDEYFQARLKQGAPEWLQDKFREYRDKILTSYKDGGYLTQVEYELSIAKSIFIANED
jgi:hypothetical protein